MIWSLYLVLWTLSSDFGLWSLVSGLCFLSLGSGLAFALCFEFEISDLRSQELLLAFVSLFLI